MRASRDGPRFAVLAIMEQHRVLLAALLTLSPGCLAGPEPVELQPFQDEDIGIEDPTVGSSIEAIRCGPRMSVFPVGEAHNIGYDARTCSTGTCAVSCPDRNANSDWGGAHHGIDVFARRGAPLVATADGVITRVGTRSSTSGLRVRLRDDCGWEYYYGHLESAAVREGQRVSAGQLIGRMGNSGAPSVHLHFNVAADGNYYDDIDPFDLLRASSPTACGAPAPPPAPTPGPAGCGVLGVNAVLGRGEGVRSCDGRFLFVHQTDGNVVLYQGTRALFHTATHGQATSALVMQDDGNLVLYAPGGRALWSSRTAGRPGASLAVQNDGNVVIYRGGAALWHTHTCCR